MELFVFLMCLRPSVVFEIRNKLNKIFYVHFQLIKPSRGLVPFLVYPSCFLNLYNGGGMKKKVITTHTQNGKIIPKKALGERRPPPSSSGVCETAEQRKCKTFPENVIFISISKSV